MNLNEAKCVVGDYEKQNKKIEIKGKKTNNGDKSELIISKVKQLTAGSS